MRPRAKVLRKKILLKDGAAKRTRTSTRVTGLAPQASASTNSAMAAKIMRVRNELHLVWVARLTDERGPDKSERADCAAYLGKSTTL